MQVLKASMIESPPSVLTPTGTCNCGITGVAALGTVSMPPTSCKTSAGVVSTPNIMRRMLPVAAFLITFTTVMTVLLVYMDTTAMRHHQFQINMTQDYDMQSVKQDDPQLIAYIREMQLRPATEPSFAKSLPTSSLSARQPSKKMSFVARLLNFKKNGLFVEAGSYHNNQPSDTEWLERNLSWTGLLVQPNMQEYFQLLKHDRINSKAIHACLSPTPYPKEITYHQFESTDGVRVNSIHDSDVAYDWFLTRVKCFPLYSLLLAINGTSLDYLSLQRSADKCDELDVLETLPFDKVKIEVISIYIPPNASTSCITSPSSKNTTSSADEMKRFMQTKNYKYIKDIDDTQIYVLNHLKI